MEDIAIPPDAGAPVKKLDEATALFLTALRFIPTDAGTTTNAKILAFLGGIKVRECSRDSVNKTTTFCPSPVQQIVAAAQQAGLVEGDVMSRLTVED